MWIYIRGIRRSSVRTDRRVVAGGAREILRRVAYPLGGRTTFTEVKIVSACFEAAVPTAASVKSKLPVCVIEIVPGVAWLQWATSVRISGLGTRCCWPEIGIVAATSATRIKQFTLSLSWLPVGS